MFVRLPKAFQLLDVDRIKSKVLNQGSKATHPGSNTSSLSHRGSYCLSAQTSSKRHPVCALKPAPLDGFPTSQADRQSFLLPGVILPQVFLHLTHPHPHTLAKVPSGPEPLLTHSRTEVASATLTKKPDGVSMGIFPYEYWVVRVPRSQDHLEDSINAQ